MKNITFVLFAMLSMISMATHGAIVGEEVRYKIGGNEFKGYLAYNDSSKKKRPGVLVVHEWWGHNEYVRKRARMLAKLGYTALALDMYGDGKQANHPKEAGQFAGAIRRDLPLVKIRFMAAQNLLSKHKTTNPDQISAIGYSFGGAIVLEMARMGVDLDGVVSFYGRLNTRNPATTGMVRPKVLVLNGAADPFVKAEEIAAFKQEMRSAGVDYRFVDYPGVKHSFTNPIATETGKKFGLPLVYNKKADKKSWKEMKKFLKRTFRK